MDFGYLRKKWRILTVVRPEYYIKNSDIMSVLHSGLNHFEAVGENVI
jgi:hypothetical protein